MQIHVCIYMYDTYMYDILDTRKCILNTRNSSLAKAV